MSHMFYEHFIYENDDIVYIGPGKDSALATYL